MKLAVVLVHYHTAGLAVEAHAALAADLRAAGIEVEWLLVDNGSRPEDREKLAALPVRVLDPGRNLGYAAGANLGVGRSSAEIVFLMNPDVQVLPGCSAALVEALESGAAAAGPRFYWDRQRRFLLPPTERRTRSDELLRLLGERGPGWARRARARWRRHARCCWTAREPRRFYELSGALLAFTRQAWQELGGFDEGYQLYFEETDWLERLRRHGLEARLVPRAEAVHLYAQSTVGEPRAESWFEDSARRFRRRFYGTAFSAVLESLGRVSRRAPPPEIREGETLPARASWLEVSSSALGFPAAGRCLDEETPDPARLPEEIRRRLPPGTYYLRTVDARGIELDLRVFHRTP